MTTISSGRGSNVSATSANPLIVLSGGTAVSATVLSGGSETVSSGGTDSGSVVQSGGDLTVLASGSAVGTKDDGGTLVLSSGASAFGIAVDSGSAFVDAGASATSATVTGSRSELVLSGGTVFGTRVSAGTLQNFGGLAVSTIVGSGGQDNVDFALGDSAATIEAGGAQTLIEGGTAISATVASGGTQSAYFGGIASDTLIQSGAIQILGSGGSAVSTTIERGGVALLAGAAVASDISIESGGIAVVLAGGSSFGATVASGGVLVALPGASSTIASGSAGTQPGIVSVGANGATISPTSVSGGTVGPYTALYVLSGGEAVSTKISGYGATETVFAGGRSLSDTVTSDANQTLSGGTASDTTLAGGATEDVDSGGRAVATSMGSATLGFVAASGIASSAVVGADAVLTIASGGSAFATDVENGGSLTENGIAVSTRIASGGAEQVAGVGGVASDSAATISAGGAQSLFAGGIAFSATVQSGGAQLMWQGGVASGTKVQSGGAQYASSGGSAVSTTVEAGGILAVSPGGSATSATIDSSAGLAVSSGGSATATTVSSGAILLVLSGGSATGTTVDSGGELVVLPGGSATGGHGAPAATPDVVLDTPHKLSTWSVSASGVALGSGGALFVLSGGTASGTAIDDGQESFAAGTFAIETVAAGARDVGATLSGEEASMTVAGSATGETLTGNASLFVLSGGAATSVTVVSQGRIDVSGGATASALVLSEGALSVAQGGTVTDTSATDFGEVVLSGGVAFSTQLGLLGILEVFAGGSATDTTLGFLSFLTVASGGAVSGVQLSGKLDYLSLQAGATVEGAVTIDPQSIATVTIYGSAMPSAVISGFGGPDQIDLAGIAYDSAGSASYNGGTLTVSEGGQTYALDLGPASAFSGGSFALLPDASGGTEIVFLGPSSHVVSSGFSGTSLSIPSDSVLLVRAGGISIAATLSGDGPFMSYQPNPTDGGALLLDSAPATQAEETNSGIASATRVEFGGNLLNAGEVVSGSVASGWVLFHTSCSTEYVTLGTSGIELDEGRGTFAIGTVVNGGLDGVADDAATDAVVVNSGGEQVVGGKVELGGSTVPLLEGVATSTTVNAGGRQFVNNSGTADATRVTSGGELVVNSGGIAFAAVIGASGTLVLNSGATAGSGIVFSGGAALLDIGGAVLPTTTISGFAAGDTIDLQNLVASGSFDSATDVLTISAGGATQALQFAGDYPGVAFRVISGGGSSSLVELACYAAGTRIATESGDVPVEDLAPGDHVRTKDSRLAPVRWVGRRRIDCRRHPRPAEVWPVRIAAHAFAPGRPRRDLLLSPDHAVFCSGVLIPVRYLVNGATIAPVAVQNIEYVHIELDRHDILLAEGLPAESFLDTGNRAAFVGGGAALELHPDFSRRVWQTNGCAELVTAGKQLAAARRRLLARAAALGHRITGEPGIFLRANGRRLVAEIAGAHWQTHLPDGVATVTLGSRTWTPAHTDPDADDSRTLGVAIAHVALDGREVALDSPALAAGWHAPEADWRWTDGAAVIPVDGVRALAFDLALTGRYWRNLPGERRAAL